MQYFINTSIASTVSPIINLFLNCVHGIRVNNQHENEAIGSKVDIKVY
jgi:hypothetical protein